LLRAGRLLAVARYEARSHMTGRQALRLLGVAAALLLPAGLIPTPRLRPPQQLAPVVEVAPGSEGEFVGPPPPPKVRVRGEIPPLLASRFELSERAPAEIHGVDPVLLSAPEVTNEMRAALETLDGPVRLEYRGYLIPGRLPGRSLLIAILAISLLTGPLADALPGERARRTLEVLLTAGISRGELIGGKWLAWTLSASVTAGVAAMLACWRGVQPAGWWLAGLPLFIASAVAFGLWLVRLVDDVVGGSAAPMRVLPVAAGSMAALARAIAEVSPVAAAAVPLGGPLLVAADLFSSGPQLLAAGAGTVVFVVAILTRTGRDLDRFDTVSSPTRWGALGLSGVAVLLWWLTVAGPGIWGGGIAGASSNLVTPLPRSMMVGGIALLACAVIAIAREAQRGPAGESVEVASTAALFVTFAVAALLAASGPLPVLDLAPARPVIDTMADRLREAGVPSAMRSSAATMFAALVSIAGQAVLFRHVVATRLGATAASLLWCAAVSPLSPWSALPASLALGFLAQSYGWTSALVAQFLWAAAVSAGDGIGDGVFSLGIQMIAAAIAWGAPRLVRGVPMRHQL